MAIKIMFISELYIIAVAVVLGLKLKFKIEKLKTENQILLMEYRVLLVRNQQKSTHNINSIPDGTAEAVKYAMKKAHPDNGGNAEDFMKFKKIYEELTK